MMVLGFYYILGRYDTVLMFEAHNEKVAMEFQAKVADSVANETMATIPREEAIKFLSSTRSSPVDPPFFLFIGALILSSLGRSLNQMFFHKQ